MDVLFWKQLTSIFVASIAHGLENCTRPCSVFNVHVDRVSVLISHSKNKFRGLSYRRLTILLQYERISDTYYSSDIPVPAVTCTKVENVLAYWFLLDVSLISPSLTVVQNLS